MILTHFESLMKRNTVRFLVGLLQPCTAGFFFFFFKHVWVFDAGASFCRVFLFHCSVRLGCIWDIDEKGWGQNVAFSYLKALSVSLGFQSVLSAERKMVV